MTHGLYLCTPSMRDAFCGHYLRGVVELDRLMGKLGLPLTLDQYTGGSHIVLARNECVARFLDTSDLTHFMFIDDDIGFEAKDVVAMLATGLDLVGGIYPQKVLNWDNVSEIAKRSTEPEALRLCAHVYPAVLANPAVSTSDYKCLKADRLPTGFMMMSRSMLVDIVNAMPWRWYQNQSKFDFFSSHIREDRLLGEDYEFCELAKMVGYQPWVYAKASLSHYGAHRYEGYKWGAAIGKREPA